MSERAKDADGRKIEVGDTLEGYALRWVALSSELDRDDMIKAHPIAGLGATRIYPDATTITHRGGQPIGDPRDMDGRVVDVGTVVGCGVSLREVVALRPGGVNIVDPERSNTHEWFVPHYDLARSYRIIPPRQTIRLTVTHDPDEDPAAVLRLAGMEVEDG